MTGKDSRSSLKARLQAGLAARQGNDHARAERIFRQVLTDHPDQADALNLLGILLAETGRLPEAAEHLEAAADARPESLSIRLNLAQTLLAANRPGEAVDLLTILNISQREESGAELLLIRALLADRRPEEATEAAQKAALSRPDDPALLKAWGDALYQCGRTDEAISRFKNAIAVSPNYGPAHNNLGTALESIDRLADAAQSYEQAIRALSKPGGARINLGIVRLRMGDTIRAIGNFAKVLEDEPFNQRAIAYLAVARQERGELAPADMCADILSLIREEYPAPPKNVGSQTEFHEALVAELHSHPGRRWDMKGTATTGGSDALRLFEQDTPALRAFEDQLRRVIDRYIRNLKFRAGHPFLGRRVQDYELDAWATFLRPGGYQYPHIHPSGWISGVYYVRTPSSGRDSGHDGWIEFNRPDESFDYTFTPEVILKQPEPGMLLMFPSYTYHRTLPFQGKGERISIAFDVKPVGKS